MELFLAPIFGVTNRAFRVLCKRHGADHVFTEMISAKALAESRTVSKTMKMTEFGDEERPLSLQLFSPRVDWMTEGAAAVAQLEELPDYLNINLCCPAPNIILQGGGSYLLKNPLLCAQMVEAALVAELPVTVKIRAGFERNNAIEVANACADAGASGIIVHGRTCRQGFRGKSNWEIIREVKENVSVPVVGNGDIVKPEDADRMVRETCCDGAMVGRAAMKDPCIFEKIKNRGKSHDDESAIHIFREYLAICEDLGEKRLQDAKMKLMWLTFGEAGSARLRGKISRARGMAEIFKLVDQQ